VKKSSTLKVIITRIQRHERHARMCSPSPAPASANKRPLPRLLFPMGENHSHDWNQDPFSQPEGLRWQNWLIIEAKLCRPLKHRTEIKAGAACLNHEAGVWMRNTLASPNRDSYSRRSRIPGVDHVFVNNVRFLSMAAVVLEHSIGMFGGLAGRSPSSRLSVGLTQPCKFGTIGFFLISGFLMGERLDERRPLEYLQRRLRKISVPWLTWFSLLCLIVFGSDILHDRVGAHSATSTGLYLAKLLTKALFESPFWFVPNLLIALSVLLLCRRFLDDLRFGFGLSAISLFSGVNLYAQWIPMGHTQALLGFVFYLWLGVMGARHFGELQEWIARLPCSLLCTLTAGAGVAALAESHILAVVGNPGTMDTLRISNQLYSVAVVLLLLKLGGSVSPRLVDVRATTFGVYLIHSIVLILFGSAVRRLPIPWANSSDVVVVLGSLSLFVFAYSCSVALTMKLMHSRHLSWMVCTNVAKKAHAPTK
jgi:membrane-bound acyltransferase YfiQ involved in biofilm formation